MKRISPVRMPMKADKTRQHNGFEVVLTYRNETFLPSLVDLSHVSKWEIETSDLDKKMKRSGLTVPEEPCKAVLSADKAMAICRLTPTRALIWDFNDIISDSVHGEGAPNLEFNNLTDGTALFFMAGEGLFSVMERLTDLDLNFKNQSNPLFLQGPVLGVPAKILVHLNEKHQKGMFISVGRGFGQSVADAILSAGSEAGLSPAGEHVFSNWSGN